MREASCFDVEDAVGERAQHDRMGRLASVHYGSSRQSPAILNQDGHFVANYAFGRWQEKAMPHLLPQFALMQAQFGQFLMREYRLQVIVGAQKKGGGGERSVRIERIRGNLLPLFARQVWITGLDKALNVLICRYTGNYLLEDIDAFREHCLIPRFR